MAAEGQALQKVGGHSDGMSPTAEGWGTERGQRPRQRAGDRGRGLGVGGPLGCSGLGTGQQPWAVEWRFGRGHAPHGDMAFSGVIRQSSGSRGVPGEREQGRREQRKG